jgi:hypothetical protein
MFIFVDSAAKLLDTTFDLGIEIKPGSDAFDTMQAYIIEEMEGVYTGDFDIPQTMQRALALFPQLNFNAGSQSHEENSQYSEFRDILSMREKLRCFDGRGSTWESLTQVDLSAIKNTIRKYLDEFMSTKQIPMTALLHSQVCTDISTSEFHQLVEFLIVMNKLPGLLDFDFSHECNNIIEDLMLCISHRYANCADIDESGLIMLTETFVVIIESIGNSNFKFRSCSSDLRETITLLFQVGLKLPHLINNRSERLNFALVKIALGAQQIDLILSSSNLVAMCDCMGLYLQHIISAQAASQNTDAFTGKISTNISIEKALANCVWHSFAEYFPSGLVREYVENSSELFDIAFSHVPATEFLKCVSSISPERDSLEDVNGEDENPKLSNYLSLVYPSVDQFRNVFIDYVVWLPNEELNLQR